MRKVIVCVGLVAVLVGFGALSASAAPARVVPAPAALQGISGTKECKVNYSGGGSYNPGVRRIRCNYGGNESPLAVRVTLASSQGYVAGSCTTSATGGAFCTTGSSPWADVANTITFFAASCTGAGDATVNAATGTSNLKACSPTWPHTTSTYNAATVPGTYATASLLDVPVACSEASLGGVTGTAWYAYPDVVTFTWAESAGGPVDKLEVRWRSTDSWLSVINGMEIGTSGSVTWPVPRGPETGIGSRVLGSQLQVRCSYDDGATWVYGRYGSTSGWSSNGEVERACTRARLYWPPVDEPYAVGAPITFGLQYSGVGAPNPGFDVQATTFDFPAASPPSFATATWATVADDVALGFSGSFTVTAAFASTAQQVILRCVDAEGTVYSGQWAQSYVYGADSTDEEARCVVTGGLSVHPSTWVPGLVRSISCTLRILFVPDGDLGAGLAEAYEGSGLSTLVGPFSSVASGVSGLASVSGTCSGSTTELPIGGGATVPVNFLESCSGPAATARNMSWWLSRFVIMVALAFALRNMVMGTLGLSEAYSRFSDGRRS